MTRRSILLLYLASTAMFAAMILIYTAHNTPTKFIYYNF